MAYLGNYRDRLLRQLMFQQMYPRGTEEEIDGEKVPIAPEYQNQEAQRGARSQASLGEDAGLRYALGKQKRETNLNDALGHTVMSDKYPGFARDLWGTEHGFTRGYRYDKQKAFMTPQEEQQFSQRGKEWGDYQRKLVGRESPQRQNPLRRW